MAFLFQQDDLHEGDMTALPQAEIWTYKNRRFAIGRGIQAGPSVKILEAAALGFGW